MMLFFSTIILLATTVVADIRSPSPTTNRERLARNLPPLPPKFVRELPGYARSVDIPTGVHSARASPSPSASLSFSQPPPPPPIVYTGRIEVRNPDTNSSLGFLENTAGGFFGINFGGGDDLHVTFSTTAPGKPVDIFPKDPKFTGPALLGGGTTNSSILSVNSGATIDFSNVEQTPPRSRPVKGPSGFWESSIWSIDPQTKEITPHWINLDGSSPPTRIAYDTSKNIIFFTGNVGMYNDASHASASLVEFFLASD